ncbi:pectate lyase family protein [Zobellia sp. B3R18]|uniref:pectate lyase family protein n=1 Tax=Zobellia sp. B3R18 TaxID=2841568 RepID=UPI001C075BD9|nr:hypothetical protein [Zobellia sp. B3R18]MBU2975927.1 hypothetical protein [Zobellia sp. B3R18]
MKIHRSKYVRLILAVYALTFLLSCSKDTDLLADLVVSDVQQAKLTANLAVSDKFLINSQESTVLDVLNNDSFIDDNKVEIIETSQPENGLIVINTDKTLTYFPNPSDAPDEVVSTEEKPSIPSEIPIIENQQNPEMEEPSVMEEETNGTIEIEKSKEEEPIEETFTYTVEVENKEGETETQEASVTIIKDMGELKAFPGAEGFGKNATGGRGGFIYHVTNLNDGGAGSLREGIEKKSGTRTIVFDVSGYIVLKSPLKIRKGYGNLTIAGQTAPDDGITLRGSSFWIHDSNVIIRYLRIRPGKDWIPSNVGTSNSENYEPDDALRIKAWPGTTVENIIIDHCSISWGRDGVLDISGSTNGYLKKLTIQNSIISENVDKGYGTLIDKNISDITLVQNLWAHNKERNILFNNNPGDGGIEFINNLIYNFKRGTILFYSTKADIIGNVYLTNSNSNRTLETIRLETSNQSRSSTELYAFDNIEDNNAITLSKNGNNNIYPYLKNSAILNSTTTIIPSSEVVKAVLPNVGASFVQDLVDVRIINDVKNGTGSRISHEDEVGGFPNLKSSKRALTYDQDKDGIPDNWEIANNLDPLDAHDANEDFNNDGYTNLEDFLFSLL